LLDEKSNSKIFTISVLPLDAITFPCRLKQEQTGPVGTALVWLLVNELK
jgi:hypothetical protein